MPGPEYKDTPEVTAEQVLDLTVRTLQKRLDLSIEGSKCHTLDILRLLAAASAERSSIESACRETETSPSGNRVREQLEAELPQGLEELRTLEASFNEVLVERVPSCVFKRRRQIAIDLVFIPYHGQPDQDEREIRRGRAKHGTTHFHCYATAYVILKNKRYTLALTYVWGNERLVEAWDALLPPFAGWRAGEEGKLRITPEGQPATGDPGETIIPREGEERLTLARWLVVERCLYSVDKNPLAVEIAKLSMWLITMDRGKPSTFLDHAFKCGDSIIGVHLDQLIGWKPENAYSQLKVYAQISKK